MAVDNLPDTAAMHLSLQSAPNHIDLEPNGFDSSIAMPEQDDQFQTQWHDGLK